MTRSLLRLGALALILVWAACSENEDATFDASGIVEGTPVKVAAQTGGYILAMPVAEGEHVESGMVVAVVDSEKLTYQLEQVEAALSELAVQYQISQNSLLRIEADFEHGETKYRRFQELYKNNSASQQVVDDLKQAYDAALTQLQNARQNLRLLDSRKTGLLAQGKLLRRQIRDAVVVAPISGTVTGKYFETGETVPTGLAVVEIIDLSEMWIKIYISEKMLARITVGQTAQIRVDGTDQRLEGHVAWISPQAEFTPKNILTEENRTALVYAVKVIIANPDKILKHGMPVELALHWQ
jgi:HlyD family secretion protein